MINKAKMEEVKRQIEEILNKELGFDIEVNKITYDENSFDVKLIGRRRDKDVMRLEFEQYCERFGFTPADYLKDIYVNGEVYKFIAFNPRARTNFCILENAKGSKTGCPVHTLKTLIENPIKERIDFKKGNK